jgi:hypothetical protein
MISNERIIINLHLNIIEYNFKTDRFDEITLK